MPEINPQELKVAENRRRFTEIYRAPSRAGADRLFAYLESTDFFSAPASTRYHRQLRGADCASIARTCMTASATFGASPYAGGVRHPLLRRASPLPRSCTTCARSTLQDQLPQRQERAGARGGRCRTTPLRDNLPYGHGRNRCTSFPPICADARRGVRHPLPHGLLRQR